MCFYGEKMVKSSFFLFKNPTLQKQRDMISRAFYLRERFKFVNWSSCGGFNV